MKTQPRNSLSVFGGPGFPPDRHSGSTGPDLSARNTAGGRVPPAVAGRSISGAAPRQAMKTPANTQPATANRPGQGSGAAVSTTVFTPPVVTPTGDGYTVKPGRPIVRLSAQQVGLRFGVSRETIYRWRAEGAIPEQFVTRAGKRKLLFAAELIPHLEAAFSDQHE